MQKLAYETCMQIELDVGMVLKDVQENQKSKEKSKVIKFK